MKEIIMNPRLQVAPSSHLAAQKHTQGMMIDVLIALTPVTGVAIYLFHWYAVKQILICVCASLITEAVLVRMRKQAFTLADCSAGVTGLILGLSLPAAAPWYAGVIAGVVAIGLGKIIFGGLGMNIFNPAMVGRAFITIAFATSMGAAGYIFPQSKIDILSQATPLTAFQQSGEAVAPWNLLQGCVNGSLGEVSALACLLGGFFLCFRRTASWEMPAGMLLTVTLLGGISDVINPDSSWTVLHHLLSGGMLFGAFFIVTDPVTCPLSPKGKWIFGAGVGALVMLLRLFSGYPEGVMFAVLLMNAVTPLINQWTIPKTMGT